MKMFLLILSLFISNNSLDKQIRGYLSKNLSGYTKFEFEVLSIPKAPENEIEFVENKEFNIARNMVYIPVRIVEKGKESSSVISVKVKLYKYALVALNPIKQKTDLDESMFGIRLVDVALLRGTPVESSREIKKLRSKGFINSGNVLIEEDIENMPVINSGDEVTAVKIIGSVSITIQAFAREDGRIDDNIKIRTVDNKQFTAKVLDSKKVFIEE